MYPILEVYPERIKSNAEVISELCHKNDISLAAVTKGANNIDEVVDAVIAGGVDYIADSRIKRFKQLRLISGNIPLMLLRIPGPGELKEVISYADISLNSEIEVIKLLNNEAKRQNKTHKVVLMVELGDLREGIYPAKKVIEKAVSAVELMLKENIMKAMNKYNG